MLRPWAALSWRRAAPAHSNRTAGQCNCSSACRSGRAKAGLRPPSPASTCAGCNQGRRVCSCQCQQVQWEGESYGDTG